MKAARWYSFAAGVHARPTVGPMLIDRLRTSWPRAMAVVAAATLLLPLWIAGIFGRDYWTPDEPREADIVWRMHQSGPDAVPQLAGTPFLEKPPLTYWLAQPFVSQGNSAAWHARIPNLLYALVVVACIVLLAYEMAAGAGAIAAATITGSFLLTYQVSIWLATDAPLMAGAALSLLGLYRGYHASRSADKLTGYSLMHVGLTIGFMAKSAAAWLVPGCTLLGLVIWDRNYRELLRWQLYAGLVVELACIVPWLHAVYRSPDGAALFAQLWFNLADRFTRLQVSGATPHQYADEHRNSFGKYWIEAPTYIFPWVFLVVATVRRAWQERQAQRAFAREWRFCIAAVIPALLLLSISTTARGIYAAPLLLGVGLAVGLWADRLAGAADQFDRRMLAWSLRMLIVLGLALIAASPLAVLYAHATALSYAPLACGALVVVGVVAMLVTRGVGVTSSHPRKALAVCYASYVFIFLGGALIYFPAVDARSDLASIAAALHADLNGRPLVLLNPDETTRAFVDLGGISTSVATVDPSQPEDELRAALNAAGPDARLLIMLKNGSGPLSSLWQRYGHPSRARRAGFEPEAIALAGGMHIEREYALPEGRSYALLVRNAPHGPS